MEMKIRRTLIGGFNRRDVVAYIEELTAARERETGDLRREMERMQAELDAAKRLGGDASVLRSELEGAKTALAEVTGNLAKSETEREELNWKLETTAAKLAQYEEADVKLSEKQAELERVKAQITDIEIAARDRADAIQRAAQEAADAARAEADRQVSDLRWRFDETRGVAGRELTGSIRELDSVKDSLQSLLDGFGEIGEKLNRITAKEVGDGDDDD